FERSAIRFGGPTLGLELLLSLRERLNLRLAERLVGLEALAFGLNVPGLSLGEQRPTFGDVREVARHRVGSVVLEARFGTRERLLGRIELRRSELRSQPFRHPIVARSRLNE